MLSHYTACLKYNILNNTNRLIIALRKLPVIGKHMKSDYSLKDKKKYGILFVVLRILSEVIKKFLFVFLFMYLPRIIMSSVSRSGSIGFSAENCYVYYAVIFNCFAGSLMHSRIFDVNKSSYINIKFMKINPAVYFRIKFIERMVTDVLGYWAAFTILGMHPVKSLYLVVIISLSRYVGETLNILIFKVSGKKYNDMGNAMVILMTAALIMGYFIPYVSGYVPSAYNLVFNSIWLYIIFFAGTAFTYYVWNNDNYDAIISRIYTVEEVGIEEGSESEESWIEDDGKRYAGIRRYRGNIYQIDMFFRRCRKMFIHENTIKSIIILFACLAAFVANYMGNGKAVSKVINYSMPLMVFVVLSISDVSRFCREMFVKCDITIIKRNITREQAVSNYIFSTLRMLKMNLFPVLTLIAAFFAAGVMVLGKGERAVLLYISAEIILLYVLFTVISMFMYYIFQPFTSEGKIKSYYYPAGYVIMYAMSYGCLFIKADNAGFLLVVGLITSVITALTLFMVYRFAAKTFVLKK